MTTGQDEFKRQNGRPGIRASSDGQHVPQQRAWMAATSAGLSGAAGQDTERRVY